MSSIRLAQRLLQARISGVSIARLSESKHLGFATRCLFRSRLLVAPCRYVSGSNNTDGEENNTNPNGASEDLSNEDPQLTEWIPPSRPLVGDKGYSHLYQRHGQKNAEDSEEAELARIERELKELEDTEVRDETWDDLVAEESGKVQAERNVKNQDEAKTTEVLIPTKAGAIPQKMDWLQTRRQKLGDLDATGLTPSYSPPGQDLSVLHHTLLSAEEIMTLLSSLGGINPNLITDKVRNRHGDTRMGGAFKGIIFVSGNSLAHLRMLSNSLVDQLKRRKLHEVGVIGARHGAEGSDDPDETWFCIDCHNYIVNIQDESTRRLLDLETWWSTGDPLAGYNLDSGVDDDEAMDNFVARNPVPFEYGRSSMTDWNASINQLEHKRWTAPHRTEKRRSTNGRGKKKKAGRR